MKEANPSDDVRKHFNHTFDVLFRAANIKTLRDLSQYTPAEVMRTKGIGRKKVQQIKTVLKSAGLAMGGVD
ncbi:hypothetical protein KKI24_22650 [bacterium]|nr:hypothetical protein [bacterium]